MFEFTEAYADKYIEDYRTRKREEKSQNQLNQIQVKLIVDSATSIINELFEHEWKDKLPNTITLLKLLSDMNKTDEEEKKREAWDKFRGLTECYHADYHHFYFEESLLRLVRFCTYPQESKWSDLKLELIGGDMTLTQEKEFRSILHDQFQAAIQVATEELERRQKIGSSSIATVDSKEDKKQEEKLSNKTAVPENKNSKSIPMDITTSHMSVPS